MFTHGRRPAVRFRPAAWCACQSTTPAPRCVPWLRNLRAFVFNSNAGISPPTTALIRREPSRAASEPSAGFCATAQAGRSHRMAGHFLIGWKGVLHPRTYPWPRPRRMPGSPKQRTTTAWFGHLYCFPPVGTNGVSRESFRVGLREPVFGEDWREVFPLVKIGGR